MRSRYRLSRRALADLRDILVYSGNQWGNAQAETYITELYACFQKIAEAPDLGLKRQTRVQPFRMVAAQKHFIIYDVMRDTVVILTIQHQKRDIEALIKAIRPELLKAIAEMRAI